MKAEKEAKFKKYAPIIIPIIIIVVALVFLAATLLVQYLWNSTLPELFGFKEITFWQTFRLFLLILIFLADRIRSRKAVRASKRTPVNMCSLAILLSKARHLFGQSGIALRQRGGTSVGKTDKLKGAEMPQYPRDTHTHEFLGSTRFAEECEDRHNHRFAGVSGPAIYLPDNSHVHEYAANTDFYEDHYHEVEGRTGPGIPVGEGRHVHFAEDVTTFVDGHMHSLIFATLIEDPVGEEENDN